MSRTEREKWDARYRELGLGAMEPSALLRNLDGVLPRQGRAIDVAGGSGRHAIWLAQRGLDVLLTDISPMALSIARQAAARAGVSLELLEIDFDSDPFPPGPWDLIVCFHYLSRPLFLVFPDVLAPGGLIVVVQPTVRNLERHAKPSRRFLLEEQELRHLAGPLKILLYEEGWLEEGRHEARLVAQPAVAKT